MKKNFSIYGYPFVGKNWIPHFTIASINCSDNKDEFINNFINYKLYLTEYIFKVSFYEVRKNNHIFLWDIDIKNHV